MIGSQIRVDVTRPLATVQLAAAARDAALDLAGWRSLAEAFEALSERADVQCVVVRGAGGRAISAGSDGSAFSPESGEPSDAQAYSDAVSSALRAVRACRHPTVAVIEGMCGGEDLDIAACCDLRVCGESSRFGAPIERSGSAASDEGLGPLAQLLGGSPALKTLRSGALIDAEHARTVGLVNRVHPDRAVVEQGCGLAARIAAGAPLVNRAHKKVLRRLSDRSPPS